MVCGSVWLSWGTLAMTPVTVARVDPTGLGSEPVQGAFKKRLLAIEQSI